MFVCVCMSACACALKRFFYSICDFTLVLEKSLDKYERSCLFIFDMIFLGHLHAGSRYYGRENPASLRSCCCWAVFKLSVLVKMSGNDIKNALLKMFRQKI